MTSLDLKCNAIDDNSLEMLAAGLVNNATLEILCLTRNPSITADGLRSLIPFLQSESCSLRDFFYYDNDINDVDAAALAHGLAKNKSLEKLWFDPSEDDCRMTSAGWHSFATLLCDTSSINNTYLSNHTLKLIGEHCNKGSPVDQVHARVRGLLRMHNNASSRDEIVISKILESHRDLDMEPFFEWELKFLPMIVPGLQKRTGTSTMLLLPLFMAENFRRCTNLSEPCRCWLCVVARLFAEHAEGRGNLLET